MENNFDGRSLKIIENIAESAIQSSTEKICEPVETVKNSVVIPGTTQYFFFLKLLHYLER